MNERLCVLASIIETSKGRIVSQREIAKALGISQQSVSRYLTSLEADGLISRNVTRDGEAIRITDKGVQELTSLGRSIINAISSKYVISLRGKVVSGLGEGKLFLSLPHYSENIKKLLGYVPYPGTLNLVLEDELSLMNRIEMDLAKGFMIPEYKDQDRVLGAVKLFPATINDVEGAVVIPSRTTHPKAVVEIISPFYLREKLSLKDGDRISFKVYL